ncbi:MAG: response regulator [Candidatus Riflebacteria bacterium]|nr:response regulator [Candidatus Riflebacteria bacterium]
MDGSAGKRSQPVTRHAGSILVVDDDEIDREILEKRLSLHSFEVVEAVDGPEALGLVASRPFDLVLLDIMMPGMSGLEVLAEIRKTHTPLDLPVIVLIAGGEATDIVAALELGASDYIVKPPEFAVALARIRTQISAKRAEEWRLRARDELARSNRELEQFAYVASHDLQEPLRMVISYLQLLERRYAGQLDSSARDFIGFAVDGAARMQQLIRDLLEFSRVGTRQQPPVATDSGQLLDAALANLAVTVREKEAVVTRDRLPTIRVDPLQITQLFQNLIGNAIKFQKAGKPEVHVGVTERAREFEFAVRDNGIGIDPSHFDRVFAIFQRLHTRAEYPGTGMGLSICKKIVERHGGRIWVESEPGVGSCFRFTLPKAEPVEEESWLGEPAEGPTRGLY